MHRLCFFPDPLPVFFSGAVVASMKMEVGSYLSAFTTTTLSATPGTPSMCPRLLVTRLLQNSMVPVSVSEVELHCLPPQPSERHMLHRQSGNCRRNQGAVLAITGRTVIVTGGMPRKADIVPAAHSLTPRPEILLLYY